MEELTTLLAAAKDAQTQFAAALTDLRASAKTVNNLGALAATLQRDAQDLEVANPGDVRIRHHLDGRFLQRTAFLVSKTAEVAQGIRRIVEGIRELQKDCAELPAELTPPVPEPSASPTSTAPEIAPSAGG